MDHLEDIAWVFDSLVGFLHGPIWNSPLQTFIEEKSIIFEPDDDHSVKNEEYKVLHEEYKNLVDLMLGTFMEDIGISPEQFELACEMSKHDNGLPIHFHHRLFEQIWAANDLTTFIRMMTQRNIELQMQALELIDKRTGHAMNLQSGIATSQLIDFDNSDENEKEVMEQIQRITLEELSPRKNKTVLPQITSRDNEEKQKVQELKQLVKSNDRLDESVSNQLPNPIKPTKEEFASRQQYLQQQRDKLVAIKKQIREKQLESERDEPTTEKKYGERPKSSKAAKLILSGDKSFMEMEPNLNIRKALAERLRNEVVDKTLH